MHKKSDRFVQLVAFVAVILTSMAGHTGHARADSPTATVEDDCTGECFVLTSMTIQGVSAYPLAQLASTYDQNLARRISVSDLVQTADAITARYRQDGYFLTRAVVAPGNHSSGSAYIVVYEGYLGAITVEGSGADAVVPILEPLKDGRALTISRLDHRLALASDIPGVTLTSRIEPLLDDPAQHRLVVTANLDRFDGGFHADNRGAETQGPWQAYVTTSVNGAIVTGDRLTVSALTVPEGPRELTFGELVYSIPVGHATRVRASVSAYTTDAPASSTGWLSGESQAAAIAVTHPLIRFRDASLWVTGAIDVRRVEQTYDQIGTVEENLTVARVTLSGKRQVGRGHVAGSAQISQGLDLFNATTAPSARHTRNDATGQFMKASATVSAYQDLGRFAGVYAAASAQWSSDPLLSSEEFYVGGPGFGRAYNYGELGGDTGMAGSVELRVGWDPKPAAVTFVQGYAFVDAGRVSNQSPAGDEHAHLASAGLGARVTLQDRTTFKVELAKPLNRRPLGEPDRGWRVFFGVSGAF